MNSAGYKVSEINCIFIENVTIMQECDNIVVDLESINKNDLYELK